MSLLPETILPVTEPIGMVGDKPVLITKNWWLLLYNVVINSIGQGGSVSDESLELLDSLDSDVDGSDTAALRLPISSLNVLELQPSDVVVSAQDIPAISRALLLSQDPILPDPAPLAQPVSTVSVGASPYTYTAPFAGTLAIVGGTVSAIAFIRQGTTVATGLTAGLIPVCRGDQVKVTYSAAPTLTFIPWSSA